MLRAGLCTVTGFEPQPDALGKLERESGPLERSFPYIIADGSRRTLTMTAASGMTSFLEPDPIRLAMFNGFQKWGRVVDRLSVEAICLDDVSEIQHTDMLKIDVQGAERLVFRGGQNRLKKAVVIHTEVSFVPLYKDQPSLADVRSRAEILGFPTSCGRRPETMATCARLL